ncbi:NAD-dependent epimerase/dehydratase family protein [Amycolatopsis sp. NPDC004747]
MSARDPLVVVLGGTGYLGSSLVARLAALGVRTRAVGRRPVPGHVRADVTRKDELASVVHDADVVVHLVARMSDGRSWRVAEDDPEAHRTTVQPMLDLLDIVGDRPVTVVTAGTVPSSSHAGYDRHKRAVEDALLAAAAAGTVRGVVLRLPTVYGAGAGSPGTGVVTVMAARAVAGLPLTLWHDGSVRRDLVHVEDVAAALWLAVCHAEALDGRAWPVGSGHAVPLGDVLKLIAAAAARRTGVPAVPLQRVPPPDYAAPGDFEDVDVDPSSFVDITGWRPAVRLEDGLDGVVRAALAARPAPGLRLVKP